MSFGSTAQSGVTQIMVMFNDNGMCVTKKDHTVWCMGSNTNAFGAGSTTQQFARWTDRSDIAFIGSGTWDQICAITTTGEVLCGGRLFGVPPSTISPPGQTNMWVTTLGAVSYSDASVLRPSETRTDCQIKATGIECNGQKFGPSDGTIVMATTRVQPNSGIREVCYLDTAGTVVCSERLFAEGKVVYLAGNDYTDSLCAIYYDGSVWCIGSNTNGKLGIGSDLKLTSETMVAPPGSALVACDRDTPAT